MSASDEPVASGAQQLVCFSHRPNGALYIGSLDPRLALELFVDSVLEDEIHNPKSGLGGWGQVARQDVFLQFHPRVCDAVESQQESYQTIFAPTFIEPSGLVRISSRVPTIQRFVYEV